MGVINGCREGIHFPYHGIGRYLLKTRLIENPRKVIHDYIEKSVKNDKN